MAFTVEDGTGLEDANSYTDVATADTYHTDRGNDDWNTLSDADKQSALVRATDYIESEFGSRIRGSKLDIDQALTFPTIEDGLPREVEYATAEAALYAARNVIMPISAGPAVKRQKLDVLEQEFFEGGATDASDVFIPAIIGFLDEFIWSDSSVRLLRT